VGYSGRTVNPEERAITSDPVQVSSTNYRWVMLFLVWLMYGCFGMTAATIAPLVVPILDDLGMTYSQMGLVLGAWQLVYIGTASPLGALVDRLGVRRSLGIGIIIIWLSLIARGLSVDFYTLFLAVALFGVGGPIISTGAPKVVSLWFEGSQRNIAAGIYTTGPLAGTALALGTAASLVLPLTGSWRGISLVYGVVVLAVLTAWWMFARDAPGSVGSKQVGADGPVPTRRVITELLRLRNMQLILVLAIATFLLNHGLNNWLPTLLQEGGMTLSQAGLWTAVSTAVGVLGVLVIPPLARRGSRALTMGLLLVVGAITTVGLAYLSGPSLIGVLMMSNIVRGPMMPIATLILMETPGIGPRRMGAAAGLFFAAAEIGGFGGPFLMGFLRDATGSLTTGVLILAGVAAALIFTIPFFKERQAEG
jgi:CP family cyanate transporter-like MFS transporter